MSETIAAIATATGAAGIGIVRVSGEAAFAIVSRVCRRAVERQPGSTLRRATIHDPHTHEPLDDGLLAVFPAPRSFTGENVVEFQGHGGSVTLGRVLAAILAAGARTARPGEFSERAFLNGKLDLTQAEAIADLIAARSVTAQRVAQRQLAGALSAQVASIAEELQEALARVEATIDFPEEVGELVPETVQAPLNRAQGKLQALLAGAAYGRRLSEGLTIVLTGPPNVGKSSLLNALTGAERAIVTALPGTTRDVLTEELILEGVPVRVLDTAGLRETDDPIEKIGVARAEAAAASADIVIAVVDATSPDAPVLSRRADVIAVNKCDLAEPHLERFSEHTAVAVSAQAKTGLTALAQAVIRVATGSTPGEQEAPLVTRARHEDALRRSLNSLQEAQETLAAALPPELIAVDLHAALATLGELTGATTREEIIQGIFARFCIGK